MKTISVTEYLNYEAGTITCQIHSLISLVVLRMVSLVQLGLQIGGAINLSKFNPSNVPMIEAKSFKRMYKC